MVTGIYTAEPPAAVLLIKLFEFFLRGLVFLFLVGKGLVHAFGRVLEELLADQEE
jgi:hypothetical protein